MKTDFNFKCLLLGGFCETRCPHYFYKETNKCCKKSKHKCDEE